MSECGVCISPPHAASLSHQLKKAPCDNSPNRRGKNPAAKPHPVRSLSSPAILKRQAPFTHAPARSRTRAARPPLDVTVHFQALLPAQGPPQWHNRPESRLGDPKGSPFDPQYKHPGLRNRPAPAGNGRAGRRGHATLGFLPTLSSHCVNQGSPAAAPGSLLNAAASDDH